MKFDENLDREYEAWIQVRDVRRAYRFLVERSRCLEGYDCFPHLQGMIRAFRFRRGKTWPFAFIVNRKSLLFYFRKAGLTHSAANETALRKSFADVKVNKRGEIKVRIESYENAVELIKLLFGSPATHLGLLHT
jgi:hypothetical protein